ncbi:MAG: M10 family metallopeptidase C-terminal domain-containing protein [Planctomycetales bacterium]|nr:M10 family metallopeptidase C-terminal domain-containing protein [Planctomycetales bacterium]
MIEPPNEGVDTLNFGCLSTDVVLDLGSTFIQSVNTHLTLMLSSLSTFESAVGGTGSDTLLGNAVANRLTGGDDDDILIAGLTTSDTGLTKSEHASHAVDFRQRVCSSHHQSASWCRYSVSFIEIEN